MAITFRNYTSSSVGTTPVTTYTVPSATTAATIGMSIANVSANQITVDVRVAGVYLVKGAPIPTNSALSVLDGRIILEAADTVVVTSSAASSADIILSVLEKS